MPGSFRDLVEGRFPMRVGLDFGRKHVDLEVREDQLIGVNRGVPSVPLGDPGMAMRQALESPVGFPALKRALTPDDHVAIVVDERLPHLSAMLDVLLEHIVAAGVQPERITLLTQGSLGTDQRTNGVANRFREVRTEVHDPSNKKKLSYLATTKRGRRLYLNRTIVDADQLVVLARRSYDPLLGYSGAEGSLYPAMSDEATREELYSHMSLAVPGDKPWPARKEAGEVAWLLGAPFIVQVIEGSADNLVRIVGGTVDAGDEGIESLNANWRVRVDSPADVVVASITGDSPAPTFADLAAAMGCAARVVKPQGRIILLTDAEPVLGDAAEVLREVRDANEALAALRRKPPPDMAAGYLWASAAARASLFLLSRLPGEVSEELYATPLQNEDQVQRLLNSSGSQLILADAHKTLAVASDDH
jgi:nickel-dependent lactate racemase